jgi:ParB family chromosome partitioning protein
MNQKAKPPKSSATSWASARTPSIAPSREGGKETGADETESQARLWEIAENLHRAELTELERDLQLAEWIRLTEQAEAETLAAEMAKKRGKTKEDKPAQSAQVSAAKGGRGKKSGISQAARELGVDRNDARRAIKVDSLTPGAKA